MWWCGLVAALLPIAYVASIGPGTVFLMEIGPEAGWFEMDQGEAIWQRLYAVPLRNLPKAAQRPVNWYTHRCSFAAYTLRDILFPGPNRAVHRE